MSRLQLLCTGTFVAVIAGISLADAQETSKVNTGKPQKSRLDVDLLRVIEPLKVNPQPRPVLIDDTTSGNEDASKNHRVMGVTPRGEVFVRSTVPDRSLRTQTILAALESPTKMEFTEMPLIDVVAYLDDYHGINVRMDERSLHAANAGNDTPITLQLKDVPLKSALNLLLEPLGLTYLVSDGVLLITTEAAASKHLELRVYDVARQIGPEVKADEVATMLSQLNQSQSTGGGMGGTMVLPTHVRLVPFRNLLIVRASQHEHEEIVGLFAELKRQLASEE